MGTPPTVPAPRRAPAAWTGLLAIGDPALVRRFADSVRQEYRAVGMHIALSPQADLAVNPRWSRVNGTFGSDPQAAARFVRGYVEGMQHGDRGIGRDSVVSVVKHWVGYGAMPAYSMPAAPFTAKGSLAPLEPVGLGFSRPLLTDVLRGRFGFDGVILSDWRITSDCTPGCRDGAPEGRRASYADIAMPWGVEELPKLDRYVKGVDAGLDQFGGVAEPEFIVEAVKAGRLGSERIDRSAYRVLLQKFQLGLFEDAFADADAATKTVGNPDGSGRRAAVLPLPPASQTRVYLHQFDAQAAREVVPTVVSIYLERPADLRAIEARAAAIVGHFGLTPAALFDVLTGRHPPTGRLPYDLPWAPSAGAATAGGAFRLGQGLGY